MRARRWSDQFRLTTWWHITRGQLRDRWNAFVLGCLIAPDPSIEELVDQVLIGHGIRIDPERRRRLRLVTTHTEDCA
jgi:hypothetical protein